MKNNNIRKIVVGKDYSYCITYVKGGRGLKGCTITDLIRDESDIHIYVSDGNSQFLWKTIHTEPLETEYDATFE